MGACVRDCEIGGCEYFAKEGAMKVKVLEDDILVPTEMLAKIYNVSSRTLNLWTKTGCPKYGRGVYSLRDVAKWIRAGIPEEEREVSKMSLAQQKLYQEARHKSALADMQEMRMQSMRGELLTAEQITEDLRRFCGVLKKELYAMGREVLSEVSADLSPERARELDKRISRRIDGALRQMSAGEFRYDGE